MERTYNGSVQKTSNCDQTYLYGMLMCLCEREWDSEQEKQSEQEWVRTRFHEWCYNFLQKTCSFYID